MVAFISLGSLSGVLIVPLIGTDSKLARLIYEYVYALMIAVGASALLSDAILHLIPHVSFLLVFVSRNTVLQSLSCFETLCARSEVLLADCHQVFHILANFMLVCFNPSHFHPFMFTFFGLRPLVFMHMMRKKPTTTLYGKAVWFSLGSTSSSCLKLPCMDLATL